MRHFITKVLNLLITYSIMSYGSCLHIVCILRPLYTKEIEELLED